MGDYPLIIGIFNDTLPPFEKGGRGDFWQGRGSKKNRSISCILIRKKGVGLYE
jgi:hypothetical protein